MSAPSNLLNLVISDAHAADAAQAAPGGVAGILQSPIPMIVIFGVLFYFMLIRPQTKRAKEHREMVAKLGKGDEVVTSGGILGRVTDLEEAFLTVEVANGVAVKVQRHAVTQVLPKGTIKGA